MSDLLIDVPFYSQLSPGNGLDPYWRERSCGILTLKMIMDYWLLGEGKKPTDTVAIFDQANELNGRNEAGDWVHATLVSVARAHGFRAWRRGWKLSGSARAVFTSEGADASTLFAIEAQQAREALPTLVESVESGNPVIISVAKDFDDVNKPHLVVLTGIRRSETTGKYLGFFYNDPYSPSHTDRKDRYVPLNRFTEKWRYQAIFVEPK